MIIKDLDFTHLSREEFIYVILSIIYWFRLDYDYFTKNEKEFLKNAIDNNLSEWSGKI